MILFAFIRLVDRRPRAERFRGRPRLASWLGLAFLLVTLAAPLSAQVIFQDGFESGDTSKWSSAIGDDPDTTPPTITVVAPAVSSVILGTLDTVIVDYSDAGSGVDPASVRVLLDGGELTPGCTVTAGRAECPAPGLELGEHTLRVEVADQEGNAAVLETTFTLVAGGGPAEITLLAPSGLLRGDSTPAIELRLGGRSDPDTLAVVVDGIDVSGSCEVAGADATCESPRLEPGEHEIEASVSGTDGSIDRAFATFELTLDLPIRILEPSEGHLTRDDELSVRGVVASEASSVTVNGLPALVDGGTFTLEAVPLKEGANILSAVASTGEGGAGSSSVTVVRDTSPPRVVLRSPPDGFVSTSSQILVTGDFADATSSSFPSREPRVLVNGIDAEVTRNSFVVADFLLQPGENTIVATGEDAAGNVESDEVTVVYLPEALRRIEEVQGNAQRAIVGQTLDQPLVVRLVDRIGNPVPNRAVTFEVTRGDGVVQSYPQAGTSLVVRTDERGLAQVRFTPGRRAGEGNHEVAARAEGFTGAVVFCASADPELPQRIKPIPAADHTGATTGTVGKALPRASFVQVFDPHGNPVPDLLVTFAVTEGGGTFERDGVPTGEPIATARTDAEGKASVVWVLGPEPGINNQRIEASFAGLEESPAVFVASAVVPRDEASTAVVGLVTDNQDRPIAGATVSIEHTALLTVTNAEGRFRLDGVPVGEIHLIVDGSTVTPGIWAKLAFAFTTIPGIDNDLGMPVRLVRLSEESESRKIVGGAEDVTLRLEGVPGAELTVWANSVTFPDGSTTGPVSVTQVHGDKVPMVPPLGSNFMLAWTIQPPGVRFDPPARIAIPNFGDPPGASVEIFSFDHDLGEFLPIGTATVSPDGTQVVSDPGFGVVKAGWHGCVPPPQPTADVCEEGSCSICLPGRKQPVPKCGECEVCEGGTCTSRTIDGVTIEGRFGDRKWEDEKITVGRKKEVVFRAEVDSSCGAKTLYEWDFGDGETGSGAEVAHEFEEGGSYRVSVVASCDGCSGAGTADAEIEVEVVVVDLEIQGLPEEDEEEPNEESPGGVIFVNLDDDNVNDVEDREEPGEVQGEDDLLQLAISYDQALKGIARLEGGGPELRVWEEPTRRNLVELPKEWDLKEEPAPDVLYLEGIARSRERSDQELVFSIQTDAQSDPIEDAVILTVVELDFAVLPDEPDGIDDHPASRAVVAAAYIVGDDEEDPAPLADESEVVWEVIEGAGALAQSRSEFEAGLAATLIDASGSFGTNYRVEGKLEAFRFEGDPAEWAIPLDPPIVRESEPLVVTTGIPVALLLSHTEAYGADGHSTQELTATVLDRNGQPVEDGTPVSWILDVSESGFAEGNELARSETVGGVARSVIQAPTIPIDQVIEVAAGSARQMATIPVFDLEPTLSATRDELDVAQDETLEVTLTVDAGNGTRVFWLTSNGTIEAETIVLGGTTSATLSSVEGVPGPVVVTATVGARNAVWEGRFTSTAPVHQVVENRFLVSDLVGNGFEPFEWPNGEVRSVPYFGQTEVVVHGPPSAVVQVSVGGEEAIEAFLFEESSGGETVGVLKGTPMEVRVGSLDDTNAATGSASLHLEAGSTASIPTLPAAVAPGLGVAFWMSTEGANGVLLSQAAWQLELVGGRVQAAFDLGAGPVELTHEAPVNDGAWHAIQFEVLSGLARLSIDGIPMEAGTGGAAAPRFEGGPLTVGGQGAWSLDDLRLYAPASSGPLFFLRGLDAARLLRLDETGRASYEVASGGLGGTRDVEQASLGVTLVSSDGTQSSLTLAYLLERARQGGEETVTWIVWVKKDLWIPVADGISSFFGGDPDTSVGTIANIAGGVLVVGDVGAIVKNGWRSLGFSQEEVNTPEVILSGIGLITEVAFGVGEVVDVPISIARALVAKLGDTPFTRVLARRMWKRIVDDVPTPPAEKALLELMDEDEIIGQGLNRVIRSEDAFESVVEICRRIGVARALENRHVRVLRAIGTKFDGGIELAVLGTLRGIDQKPFDALVGLGDEQFEEAMEGLAKVLAATAANVRHTDPELLVKVLNNENIIQGTYGYHRLLVDMGKVSDVPGAEKLIRSLKIRNVQSLGFRYELEAAVALKDEGWALRILGERVLLSGYTPPRYTDLDIFGIDPTDGLEYALQVKRSANAIQDVNRSIRWIGAMARSLNFPGPQIRFVLPENVNVPARLQRLFDQIKMPDPLRINHEF